VDVLAEAEDGPALGQAHQVDQVPIGTIQTEALMDEQKKLPPVFIPEAVLRDVVDWVSHCSWCRAPLGERHRPICPTGMGKRR